MKKILLAGLLCVIMVPATNAQLLKGAKKKLNEPPVATTTTTLVSDDGGTTTIITPGLANTTDVKVQPLPESSYPVNNGGIIVPDHAYEPAGTATVGFFGNGMGGSTIGSTPVGGGTGLLLEDLDQRRSMGGGQPVPKKGKK